MASFFQQQFTRGPAQEEEYDEEIPLTLDQKRAAMSARLIMINDQKPMTDEMISLFGVVIFLRLLTFGLALANIVITAVHYCNTSNLKPSSELDQHVGFASLLGFTWVACGFTIIMCIVQAIFGMMQRGSALPLYDLVLAILWTILFAFYMKFSGEQECGAWNGKFPMSVWRSKSKDHQIECAKWEAIEIWSLSLFVIHFLIGNLSLILISMGLTRPRYQHNGLKLVGNWSFSRNWDLVREEENIEIRKTELDYEEHIQLWKMGPEGQYLAQQLGRLRQGFAQQQQQHQPARPAAAYMV